MTFCENICGRCGSADRRPEMTQLTRRALSVGAAAALCGAALHSADRFLVRGAAAETMPSNASDLGATQPAACADASTTEVIIENFTFSPDVLTVSAGTVVTWVNRDDIPHTVTSDDKTTFASSLLDTGDDFTHQFNDAGTFAYFCSVHPMMTAKVVVEA
jgi:plastocyanin